MTENGKLALEALEPVLSVHRGYSEALYRKIFDSILDLDQRKCMKKEKYGESWQEESHK